LRTPLEKCERAEEDEDNDRDEEQAEEPALVRLGRSVEFGCHKMLHPFRADKILPQNGRQAVA
jgi:hypothetical protein